MREDSPIVDTEAWERVGRGKGLQFFATDEEMQGWVSGCTPERYRPYYLVGSDLVREGGAYVQRPFRYPSDELIRCLREAPEGSARFDAFLMSERLTPALGLRRGMDVQGICAFNGFVLLQHGRVRDGRRESSSVAIVHRVRNLDTGEERRNERYLEVYEALRKAIRKALVYSSIQTGPDGTEYEDTRLERMTLGAVRSHEEGVPFRNRPGRPL